MDGLDECGDYRRTVAKSIAAWGYGHPYQMIIVTSRPIGYDLTELADYNHYQILPMDEWQMESSSQKLMELVQQDCEKQYQWFRKRLKNYELHKLACRSPLVLGFMVQLSLQKRILAIVRSVFIRKLSMNGCKVPVEITKNYFRS